MKRISIDDLDTAIAWLECNDGDNGEAEACQRVALWLEKELVRREKRAASNVSVPTIQIIKV